MIKQDDNETEVNQGEHADHSPEALERVEKVEALWSQVGEGAEEHAARYDTSPPVGPHNLRSFFWVLRKRIVVSLVDEGGVPDVTERNYEHQLDVIRNIRDERQKLPVG